MKKTIALFCVLLLLFGLTSVTAAAADEEETVELARLVGTWEGEGTSKTGDVPITLTVRIAPDGTGVYEFEMESMGRPYHESYPFLLSREDSRFSLDTPAEYPGKIEGTWELKDNVLLLDIVATFAGGGESAWVAECRKTAVTEGIPAEYEWLSYTLYADSAELVPPPAGQGRRDRAQGYRRGGQHQTLHPDQRGRRAPAALFHKLLERRF